MDQKFIDALNDGVHNFINAAQEAEKRLRTDEPKAVVTGYYVVRYRDSERGWGSETWFRGFDSENEAKEAVRDTNARNTASTAPDYYIQAYYEGFMKTIPEGFKE